MHIVEIRLIVGRRQAGGQPVVHGQEIRAAVCIRQRVIVISPRIAGSVVSNSTTSTARLFVTSFTKWP